MGQLSSLGILLLVLTVSQTVRASDSSSSDPQLDAIIVTATLRAAPTIEVPASITVLDSQTLQVQASFAVFAAFDPGRPRRAGGAIRISVHWSCAAQSV